MLKEFKTFVLRGNIMDMAVGVIIGGAFGKIVDSVVKDVIMPPIGLLIGNMDFNDLKIILRSAQGTTTSVTINYGVFLNHVINFGIIAFAIFMLVRTIHSLKREQQIASTERKCTECLMLIPIEARRCGHCTQAMI